MGVTTDFLVNTRGPGMCLRSFRDDPEKPLLVTKLCLCLVNRKWKMFAPEIRHFVQSIQAFNLTLQSDAELSDMV